VNNNKQKSNIPNYDSRDLPAIECQNIVDGEPCGNTAFLAASEIKKVPSLVEVPGSPIGHEGYISVSVALCPKCWGKLPQTV